MNRPSQMVGTSNNLVKPHRSTINQIDVTEFVGRLKYMMQNHDGRFAFFLGAGCSISSGISAASALTEMLLRRIITTHI